MSLFHFTPEKPKAKPFKPDPRINDQTRVIKMANEIGGFKNQKVKKEK